MTDEASKRFPFINLEKAVGRAKQLFNADMRGNEMSNAGAFVVWGYSEKSSGGFQTVAALKAYGLIDIPNAAKIKLSKQAFDFFRDEREDERRRQLQAFAMMPPFFVMLYREWETHPPSDALARTFLKLERGLNEQSARSVLSIYKDNLSYAGFAAGDKVSDVEAGMGGDEEDPTPVIIQVGDYVQWTSQGVDQLKTPRKVLSMSDGFLRVHGSNTGIPMSEATVVAPPAPPKPSRMSIIPPKPAPASGVSGPASADNDINVLLTGKRLQITADVDAAGLKTLTEMIEKYQDILRLLNRQ